MKTKSFEVRDRMTMIPVMTTILEPGNAMDERVLCEAGIVGGVVGGKGEITQVQLTHLTKGIGYIDPYDWDPNDGRTMKQAHIYISRHFHGLCNGDVIDIEYILGESLNCKESSLMSLREYRDATALLS